MAVQKPLKQSNATRSRVVRDAKTGKFQVVRDTRMQPVSVVISFDDFRNAFPNEAASIIAEDESAEDAELITLANEVKDEPTFPMEIVKRLSNGENPVKVYREHRGFTQPGLARLVGVSTNYVSMIETGKKTASRKLQAKLAGILGVDYDDLETWAVDED